ncbi:hypothetical protein BHE74_00030441 [Ensete ventricosum]|nr:hypothetical protein BHE74_00030441 [Ensete ventricosum]
MPRCDEEKRRRRRRRGVFLSRFSLLSGKAPYRAVHTGLLADWYVDCPLSGGTIEIDRRRSIEGEIRKKEKREKEKKRRSIPSPVPRPVRRLRDSSPVGEESPAGDSFSPRGEKDRGDVTSFLFV